MTGNEIYRQSFLHHVMIFGLQYILCENRYEAITTCYQMRSSQVNYDHDNGNFSSKKYAIWCRANEIQINCLLF